MADREIEAEVFLELKRKGRAMPRSLLCASAAWAGLALFAAAGFAQTLDLLVNPDTGSVALHNESFSVSPSLDGYEIDSTAGSLVAGGLNGFTAHGVSGWDVAGSTTTSTAETNLFSSSALRIGATYSLGNDFAPGHTHDLVFKYSNPSTEMITTSSVVYTNVMQLRIISLLNGNGAIQSTAAVILNGATSSAPINSYTIASPSGSLNSALLHGFTASSVPGWQTNGTSATSISESNPSNTTSLSGNGDQALGMLFNSGHAQDLTFTYKATAAGSAIAAPTVYFAQLSGDANADGTVNGLDISLISGNWLASGKLPGDVNYDGVVNGLDIAQISGNWLASLTSAGVGTGAGATMPVPEPASGALLLIGFLTWASCRRRRRAVAASCLLK